MIDGVLDNLRTYWIAYALLAAYTILLARHAWAGNRRTRGVADYFVGGRSIGPVAIGLSFFATYSSTNSFVGFSGQAYDWGVTWFLLVPFVVGMSLFAWLAVAPRLRTFTESMGSLTIPDFIGFRFGSSGARFLAALIVLMASFFYMTGVFKGIGNLLEVFLEIPYRGAIAVVLVVVMVYTVAGGFISVVKTDALQGLVMILAAALLFRGVTAAAGGLGSWRDLASSATEAPLLEWGGSVPVSLVLGVVFATTIKFAVEPRQLSRFYALESREAARRGLWVSTLAFTVVYALLIPVGLYARNVIPGGIADTDLVVPRLLAADGVFSAGSGAFLLVAMVAAAMSSLDSVLLVMASTMERDVVGVARRRLRSWRTHGDALETSGGAEAGGGPGTETDAEAGGGPEAETGAEAGGDSEPESRAKAKAAAAERSMLGRTRLWVALFAVITAVIALNPPGGVVRLTSLSGAVYGACFAPPLVLGLYWRRGNGRATVAAFATGLTVLVLWPESRIHEVFPAVALSFLAYVAVAIATRQRESADIDRLFKDEQSGGPTPSAKFDPESPALELSGHEPPPGPSSDRAVGLVFAAAAAVVGLWPLTAGGPPRGWALGLAGAFALVAVVKPELLAPLNKAWYRLGMALHRLASPVVVAVIYYVAVVPTGLLLRVFGKDVLRLRFDSTADSYWMLRDPAESPPESMKNQY